MDELLEALSVGPTDVNAGNDLQDDDLDENDTDDDDDDENEEISDEDSEDQDPDHNKTNADCELDLRGNRMLQPDQVVECCRGLVVYEKSTGFVQFSHETVRTFIERELKPTAINIAKTCITYLTSPHFDNHCVNKESVEKRAQKYKFSRYAAQFWAVHTKGQAENEPDVQRAVLSLLASEKKKDSMLQLESYADSLWYDIFPTERQTLLHVICKNGLATICKQVLSRRVNENDTYVDI